MPQQQASGLQATDLPGSLEHFLGAQDAVVARLTEQSRQLAAQGRADDAAIFDAQGELAHDPALSQRVELRLRAGVNLAAAIDAAVAEMSELLEKLDDPYLRERAADVRAVGQMLLAALSGGPSWLDGLPEGAIIVAPDLTPADTFDLQTRAAGFATAYGGPTGHTAILARSLGIPAVVGLGAALLEIPDGTLLVLDGGTNTLLVAPSPKELSLAERQLAAQLRMRAKQVAHVGLGALSDGYQVPLWANIAHPDQVQLALDAGAEGIGLFRSEFLFLNRAGPPGEEEQRAAYSGVLAKMGGRPVVIRTLDVGGDKPLPYLAMPTESNPFLGVRGLRLCMREPGLFRTQLRALLRAAIAGDLWIMLPMVATLEDLAWGRAQLAAAAAELAAEGLAHRADARLGIMIETPAAVAIADLLAEQVQFFSIGSNDLAQYTLAADRGNSDLAARYRADSLPVLRLIAQAAAAARAAGIRVGLCGELAGDPAIAPALVGLGVGELSMAPALLPAVRQRLAAVTLAEAQELGRQAAGR